MTRKTAKDKTISPSSLNPFMLAIKTASDSIIATIPESLVLVGTDGCIISANHATLELLGYREDELKGQPAGILFDARSSLHAIIKNIAKTNGFLRNISDAYRSKDGRSVSILFSESAVVDDKGEMLGAVFAARDMTGQILAAEETRRVFNQLIHAEKMAGVGTLAAGVAHEFNNLLQIMRMSAEYAERTGRETDFRDANRTVLETTARAAKIVGNLLNLSRPKPPSARPENLHDCIESVLALAEFQLNRQGISVVKRFNDSNPALFDNAEMQQVFLNLITNARDAIGRAGGVIEVNTGDRDGRVFAEISDNGAGISGEHISRIFEPFYTTKTSSGVDSAPEGTGLGLSVSYNIVRKYSGSLAVASPRAGGHPGTTFTVSLPALERKTDGKTDTGI